MNEKYLVCKEGFSNIIENGKTIGFQLRIRIPYYAGVPLSMVDCLQVRVDGEKVPDEDIRFKTSCGEMFSLREMETVTTYFWQYGEKAQILVLKDGGLAPGKYRVEAEVGIRVIYMPPGSTTRAWADLEMCG